MTRQPLEIDGITYWLKIGLKGIIYLQSLPEYKEEDIFVASIITLQELSISEAKSLFRRHGSDILFDMQTFFTSPFLSIDVRDLYSKAVGEMGISPAIFFQMAPDEIELAYDGYLRRQELSANLSKLAFLQALNGDKTTIKLLDDPEYKQGNIHERETTFIELGISNGEI